MSMTADQMDWLSRLAELSASGLPLAEGLRTAAQESPRGRDRKALEAVAKQLEAGVPWEQVLGTRRVLSPYMFALVQAGMTSGSLADALDRVVDHHRQRRDVWRQLSFALAYPALVFGLALALLMLALLVLVPEMAVVYEDFGMALPAITIFWFQLSRILPSFALCAGLGLAILLLFVRMFTGRIGWHRFVGSMPIFGPMIHWAGVAELIRLLEICLAQQMRLPQALSVSAEAVSNPHLARIAHYLADGTSRGVTLAQLMDATPRVPNFIVPMVRWGEQEARLPEALASVHQLLIGRIRMRSTILSGILAPLVFVFVGATVGALIVGMYVPLFSIIQNLS